MIQYNVRMYRRLIVLALFTTLVAVCAPKAWAVDHCVAAGHIHHGKTHIVAKEIPASHHSEGLVDSIHFRHCDLEGCSLKCAKTSSPSADNGQGGPETGINGNLRIMIDLAPKGLSGSETRTVSSISLPPDPRPPLA